jgi:hypothetical protein
MVRCIDAKRLLFNRESVLGTRGRKRAPKGNWIKSMVLIATLVDWHNSTLCQSASLRIPNSFRLLVQNSCRPHGLNWQAATQQKQDFLETVLVVERAAHYFFPEIEKKQLEISSSATKTPHRSSPYSIVTADQFRKTNARPETAAPSSQ